MKTKAGFFERSKLALKLLSGNTEVKSVSGIQFMGSSANFMNPSAYNLAQDGYSANAIAFYCINLVASAAALVPLRVYRRKMVKGKLTYEWDPEHELNKFVRQPNPDMSGQRFQHALHAYQLIAGNSYIVSRFRNAQNVPTGEPFEWDVLRPDRTIVRENNGIVQGYTYTNTYGATKDYPINPATRKSAILHLKDFNPIDDFYGMSSLAPASKQVDIANQAARFNKAMLDNGARLSVALKVSQDISPEDADNVRNQFIGTYAGASNAGRPIILQNIDEVVEMGVNPRDMEFTESQNNAFRLIANTIGVPTYMLGLKDTQSTFNNMQEAKTFFYQTTVAQRIAYFYGDMDGDIEGEINLYLQKFYGDDICIKPVWDKVDALAPVREKRYQRAKEMSGIWTIDEQRELTGKDPLDLDGISNLPWRGVSDAPITFETSKKGEDDQGVDEEDSKKSLGDGGFEYKLLTDGSVAARQRELRTFDRMLSIHERKFAPKMANIINQQASLAASEYQLSGNMAQIEAIFENSYAKTLELYKSHYRSVMRFFGGRILDAFGKGDHMVWERKEAEDLFDMAVRRFIELFAAREVRLQSETTKGLIRTAILDGEVAGNTRREIAKNILKAAGGAVSRTRSLLIASTETHGAANYAQKEAAKAATGEDAFEWVAAEDGRTRPTHAAADGQVIEDGEQFKVGGVPCDYPGDPMLPAKERCRCRCAMVFVLPENRE